MHLPDSRSEIHERTWLLVHRQAGEKWAGPSVNQRIVGPLYHLEGSLSSMANQGVPSVRTTVSSSRAKGLYRFGVNGELIKSVYLLDSNTPRLQEWTLTIEDKTARWVKGPRREALRLLGMFDPHYIESVGGRYAVQEESDGALRALRVR